MNITFEFFGVLERLAGSAALALELPAGSTTVEDALEALAVRLPGLSEPLTRSACAIGDQLVPRIHRLTPGTHLVLLPPVAGG